MTDKTRVVHTVVKGNKQVVLFYEIALIFAYMHTLLQTTLIEMVNGHHSKI